MENPFLEIEKMLADLKRQLAETKPASEWMTLDEVCEYLNLSKSNLYKLSMNNSIPLYRIGRILKFKKSEIDAWISQHRAKRTVLQGVEVEA
jgi:excisionase family DNA binding protein